MRLFRLFAAACLAAVLLICGSPVRADPPTIADFVAAPALNNASLSPSGRYLVWAVRTGGINAMHIRDLETDRIDVIGAFSSREHFGGVYINWITWKTDDRLLVGVTRLELQRHAVGVPQHVHRLPFFEIHTAHRTVERRDLVGRQFAGFAQDF